MDLMLFFVFIGGAAAWLEAGRSFWACWAWPYWITKEAVLRLIYTPTRADVGPGDRGE